MHIQSVKSNRQTIHLPRKFLPLVWFILQRRPFFTRKNGRIGTASDSLFCILYFGFEFSHASSMIKRHSSTPSNFGSRQTYRQTGRETIDSVSDMGRRWK